MQSKDFDINDPLTTTLFVLLLARKTTDSDAVWSQIAKWSTKPAVSVPSTRGEEVSVPFTYKKKAYSLTIHHAIASKDETLEAIRQKMWVAGHANVLMFLGSKESLLEFKTTSLLDDLLSKALGAKLFLVGTEAGESASALAKKLRFPFEDTPPSQNNYLTTIDVKNSQQLTTLLNAIFLTFDNILKKTVFDLKSLQGPTVLRVTILKGTNLAAGDISGKSDPYCKFGLGPKVGVWSSPPQSTKHKKQTLNPVWKEGDKRTREFSLLEIGAKEELIIEVWDQDSVGADRLGYCSIPVSDLSAKQFDLPIKAVKKEKASGTISIQVEYQ